MKQKITKQEIKKALNESNCNFAEAARKLGITREGSRYLAKKYNLLIVKRALDIDEQIKYNLY